MRVFLILLVLFIPADLIAAAEPSIPNKVENINLNLKEDEAAVTFFGLSAGESILIQGPNSKNILINMGGKGTKAELEAWLHLYDVKEIPSLILTDGRDLSFDKLCQLILKYNIKEIITTPEMSAQLTKVIATLGQISIVAWGEGTMKEILPRLTAEVQFAGNEQDEGLDLKLEFFKHSIFLMTSSSPRAEQMLMRKKLQNINVFKLPNRLKDDSLSDSIIQYFNPQISILSAADENQPDPEILHDLHDIWSEVYFTKVHGTVTIKFTKSNYEVISIPLEADD